MPLLTWVIPKDILDLVFPVMEKYEILFIHQILTE